MTSQSLINIALTLPEHGTTIADVDQHPDAYHHSLLASERQKADVTTTSEVARALLFNPADCPIVNIAYYRDGLVQSIAQIHAGAKGIMSDVAGKALAQFKKRGLSPTDAVAYLAPHGQTYTLYGPPLEQAEQGGLGAYLHPTKQPGHKRFDMMAATIDQLTDAGVPFDQIQASYVDTLEDPRYYSQRIQSSRATESQQNNPDIPPFGRNAVMFVKK
jgi:copper oxidase (laccase) domain-containing protein